MYRYVDREITALGETERLLVLAMRDWVAAASRGRCPVDAVMPRMLAHRLIGGLEPFHFIMATLARHGRTRFEFACPCHKTISEGEAVLLGAFLPRSHRDGPPRRFGWLVEAAHAERVGEAFGALRSALALAGLPLARG
jgi:hypothetical protein